ncbi:N-acetylmuramoyl-L-alanine amidase [Nocardiopsis alba]|uniref:N-acetylmuramoyl-L-alanine amidase n=1 Tax=Nocardiopsis alba TaxID=53437 RepID=UPI00034AC2A9|nr:N-acetylmuramoyl-L-alanine amidase [Nocardiopsis alba]
MVSIIGRSDWGARSPRDRTTVSWSQRTGFTVHYSAGPTSQTPRQIQDFHMDSNGWADIGYNFLVDRSGKIYEGRGWTVVGAHAAPHNTSHIGVCFIGRDGDAGKAAKNAIRSLYDEAVKKAGKKLSKTWHGGLSGNSTDCPGADLRGWVEDGMPSA